MHPVQEFRNEVAALNARLDDVMTELRQLITNPAKPAVIEDPLKPVEVRTVAEIHQQKCDEADLADRAHNWRDRNPGREPPNVVQTEQISGDGTSLRRDASGKPVFDNMDTRPFLERRLEAVAQHKAEDAATLADMQTRARAQRWPVGVRDLGDGLPRDVHGKIRPDLMAPTYAPVPWAAPKAPIPTPDAASPVTAQTPRNVVRPHAEQTQDHPEMLGVEDDLDLEVRRLRLPDVKPDVTVTPVAIAAAPEPSVGNPSDDGDIPDRPFIPNFVSQGAA